MIVLEISWNIVGDFNNETNFPHKLLLTNTQVSKLHKAFAKVRAANLKSPKTQLHKIGKPGAFLVRL